MRLPSPRGPLSEHVIEALADPPREIPGPRAGVAAEDPLRDEDLNLALYLLYELHYRSFDGVDDGWEWEPSILALRARLEGLFESALREVVGTEPGEGEDVAAQLAAMLAAADGPSLSGYVEHEATLGEFREMVVHRSAYQLKELDPHSFALPRLEGRPKVAFAEIQGDEYGGGRPDRLHAKLFAETMEALRLEPTYGAYLDAIPGVSLAAVNAMSLFGLHRRLRGAAVGHLAAVEMDSSIPNRRYADALRRLEQGAAATDFYDEHVEADAVHEQIAAHDMAGALATQDAALIPDILLGARTAVLMDEHLAGHVLGCWQRSESSLLHPLPELVPA